MLRTIGTFLFFFFIGVALAETDKEMRVIAYIESSSGKNLNHPVVVTGMHKGHQASGKYGLMPLTVKDLVSKNFELRRYSYLMYLTPQEITAEINVDKVADKTIATFLWNKLRKKFGPPRAAYAWYFGSSKAQKVAHDDLLQAEYVKKFMKEMERINEEAIKRTRPVGISAARRSSNVCRP